MFGVDPDIGSSALRIWVAAGSAALLVFVCALAFDWTRTRTVARIGVVVLGAVLGSSLAWAFLDAASVRDQNAERRALEMRAAELNTQTLAPGSALSCLNGLVGDSIETACEKALFASPATVAMATSYVAARLALLSDIVSYTKRGGANIDSVLQPLRRSLEADRFGFVAHTLGISDNCTSDNCKPLALLHDASRVRTNLSGQTLDRYLDHYLTAWSQAPDGPMVDAQPVAGSSATAALAPSGQRKVVLDIDFPSAASIPPVSIMNAEPKGPVVPSAAAAAVAAGAASASAAAPADANAPAGSSPKQRSKKQAVNQPPQAAAPAPVAAPVAATPVEPVWMPGTAPNAAPAQLSPVPAPPQASAGTARAQ